MGIIEELRKADKTLKIHNHWKGKYRKEQENMEREEHDQRITDHNEEQLIAKHIEELLIIECPYYHGHEEGIGSCVMNKMRPCQYELGEECDIYQEYLRETKND